MEENIILLGPKAVGKSSIAPALAEMLKKQGKGDYEVFSLDVFVKHCREAYNEELFIPRSQMKSMLRAEIAQLDPNDPDFELHKEMVTEDFEKSYDEIYDLNDKYQLPDFREYMESYETISSIQEQTHMFSNEAIMVLDQVVYLKVLEKILKKAKKPLIIDAGGNIGPIYECNDRNLIYIQYKFPDIDIKTYQDKVMEQIPIKIYLEPTEEYENLSCRDIHDDANKLYRQNPNSYKKYANVTVPAENIYTREFDEFDRSNPVIKILASKFLDDEKIEEICKKIVSQMEQIKTFE